MSTRRLISSGSSFEAIAGYSRAVVDGDDIFVSGTTGYDYAAMELPEDLLAQTHGCFRNIASALGEAGGSLDDVVRVRYIVTRAEYADEVFPIFGQYFGTARPAATLIVAGLLQPEMKIEIEVTARRRR
ncbi:RidA family protein [Ancylobacter amanitiformis]|uniref:Enamine deaminase RidA (YjgF/YER057c/UK114 family) n=1 Tax=Ancylobacter amanitiformis TaxID=217069 RepID=A0ABU0LPC6_9HYPH|nr:RidA family protein [Ancylobacter amanitiformis]MDQ0510495.1 enamine deaminase RidA (YjgF/YER057c/UK114 family) [Ancylobacter amanitiformis]